MAVEGSVEEVGLNNGADDAFDFISDQYEIAATATATVLTDPGPGEVLRLTIDPGTALKPEFGIDASVVVTNADRITVLLDSGGTIELLAPPGAAFEDNPPLLLQPESVLAPFRDQQLAESDLSKPENSSAFDGTALEVPQPQPGDTVTYTVQPGQTVVLGFSIDDVEVLRTATDIIFIFPDGAQVVFGTLVGLALGDNPPDFQFPDQTIMGSRELLENAGDIDAIADTLNDLATAAGDQVPLAPVTNYGDGTDEFGEVGFPSIPTFTGGDGAGGGDDDDPPVIAAATTPGGPEDPPPPPPPVPETEPDPDTAPGSIGPISLSFDESVWASLEDLAEIPPPPTFLEEAGALNVDFGDDGAAETDALVFVETTATDLNALGMTVEGEPVIFTLSEDGMSVTGSADGEPVLNISLSQDGDDYSYTVELHSNMDHPDGEDANAMTLPLTVRATDGDGSTSTGTLSIEVVDDMPSLTAFGPALVADTGSVQESGLTQGSDPDPADITTTGSLGLAGQDLVTIDYGADGAAPGAPTALQYGDFDLEISGPTGLTSDGAAVTYLPFDGETDTLTAVADGETVFTVTANADGTFSFTLAGPLDHATGDGNNVTNLGFTLTGVPSADVIASVADFDQDAADFDGISVTQEFSVTVTDDVPVAVDEETQSVAVDTGTIGSANGADNLLANDTIGADGAEITSITYTDAAGDEQTSALTDGTITVTTQFGELTVGSDGSWSYTADTTKLEDLDAATAADGFTYALTDGDGDVAVVSAEQGITVVRPVPEADLTLSLEGTGGEDTAFDLSITASLPAEQDTLSVESVTISGIDAGASILVNGISVAIVDGSVTIAADDLDSVQYQGATHTDVTDQLSLTARVVDSIGGSVQEISASGEAVITAIADEPVLTASADAGVNSDPGTDDTVTASDDGEVLMTGGGDDTVTGGAGADTILADSFDGTVSFALTIDTELLDDDGSETLSVFLSGMPEDATLSNDAGDVLEISDGTIFLSPDELAGLTLTVDDDTPAFDLAVSSTAIDRDTETGDEDVSDAVGQVISIDPASAATEAGSDTVDGGAGIDTVDAEGGDDTGIFTVGEGGAGEFYDGGEGTDALVIRYTASDLENPEIRAELIEISEFIAANADASTDSGETRTFEALGLTVQDWETVTLDGPTLMTVDAEGGSLDEDDLAGTPAGSDETPESTTLTQSIDVDFGAAGPGSDPAITFTSAGVDALNAAGLTSGGSAITFAIDENGDLVGSVGEDAIVTASISSTTVGDETSYSYSVSLQGSIDHADQDGENTVSLPLEIAAEDGVGAVVNASFSVAIVDDVPTAVDDEVVTVTEATGNAGESDPASGLLANDVTGSDGGEIVEFVYTDADGNAQVAEAGETVSTLHGTLVVNANGTWSYASNSAADNNDAPVSDGFTYTLRDGDGDLSTATQGITITDGTGPSVSFGDDPLATEGTLTVSEDDLDTDTETGSDRSDSVTQSQSVEIAFGPDGAADEDPVVFAEDAATGLTALNLSSESVPVTFALSEDGLTLVGSAGDDTIVTIALAEVSAPDGSGNAEWSYSVTLDGNLDHPAGDGAIDLPITLTVTDGDGTTASPEISVAIADDAATAVADSGSTTEGGEAVTGNLIDNDTLGADGGEIASFTYSDANGDSQTATPGGAAVTTQFGTLSVAADGTYSFTPNASVDNTEGAVTEAFTYTLEDSDGDQSTATVSIEIGDTVFVAVDDSGSTTEGGEAVTGNLIDNDTLGADGGEIASFTYTDANGDSQTATPGGAAVTTQFGTLSVAADGTYSFTPNASVDNTEGAVTEAFTYTLEDSDGDQSTATVSIEIGDTVSVAVDDSGSTTEGGDAVTGNLIDNDTLGADGGEIASFTYTDANGDSQTAIPGGAAVTTQFGTLSVAADGTYSFTPNASVDNTEGAVTEAFTYTLEDSDGDQSTATVSIEIGDTVSVAVDDSGSTTEGGEAVTGNLIDNDTLGADGGEIASFTYTDPNGDSQTATPGGAAVTTQFGTLSVAADGSYSFTPNASVDNTEGAVTEAFTYTLEDSDGDTSTAIVSIEIGDTVSVAVDDIGSTTEGGEAVTGNLIDNDTLGADGGEIASFTYTDANGDSQTATPGGAAVTTQFGTLSVAADGSYSFTPNTSVDNTEGAVTEAFTYTLEDSDGDQSTATVSIEIGDTVSVAVDDSGSTTEGGEAVTGNLIDNDTLGADGGEIASFTYTDPNGDSQTATPGGAAVTTQFGTLSVAADGSYSFTPNTSVDNTEGAVTEAFTYTLEDSDGDQSTATVSIEIGDTGPAAVDEVDLVLAEGSYTVGTDEGNANLLDNDTIGADVEGAGIVGFTFTDADGTETAGTIGSPLTTDRGVLTVNADGSWSFEADTDNLQGLDGATDVSFTYILEDGDGSQSSAEQVLTLTPPLVPGATVALSREGNENERIDLNIAVTLSSDSPFVVLDGVTLTGIPNDASLFDGDGNPITVTGGSVELTPSQLEGLQIQAGTHSGDDISTIVATAHVTNTESDVTSDTSAGGTVIVHAVADAPVVTVDDAVTLTGDPGTDDVLIGDDTANTLIGGGGDDTITGAAGDDMLVGDTYAGNEIAPLVIDVALVDQDTSETLNDVSLSGIPSGATLLLQGGGEITVGEDPVIMAVSDLPGLQVSVPTGTEAFQVTVSATTTDLDPDSGDSDVSTPTLAVIDVTPAAPVADGNDTIAGGEGDDTILGNGGDDILYGGTGEEVVESFSGQIDHTNFADTGSGFTVTARQIDADGNLTAASVDNVSTGNSRGGRAIGVKGSPESGIAGQLGYDPTEDMSEELIVDFDNPVSSISFDVSNLYRSEGQGGEQGTYTIYSNGEVIGQADFQAASGNQTSVTVEIPEGQTVDQIVFSATPYGGSQSTTNDSSDYWITNIDFAYTAPADIQDDDILIGGAGDDQIFGEAGDDTLEGGADDDILDGGTGIDSVSGGTGTDAGVFTVGQGGEGERYDGGIGEDTLIVRYSAADLEDPAIVADLRDLQNFIAENADSTTDDGAEQYFAALGLSVQDWESVTLEGPDLPPEDPIAIDDGLDGVLEGGNTITGAVLENDQAPESATGLELTAFTYTDPSGNLQNGTIGSPVTTQFGTLTVQSDGTYEFTSNDSVDHSSGEEISEDFTYTVETPEGGSAQASATITILDSDPTVTVSGEDTSGSEDTAIPVDLSVALTSEGPDDISVTVSGLPTGAILSAGAPGPVDGTWLLAGSDLEGLTLTPTANFSGEIDLSVSAESTDRDGDETSDTASVTVFVAPVADTIALTVDASVIDSGLGGDDVLTGTDDANEILGGAGSDEILGLNGDDLLYGDLGQGTVTAALAISAASVDTDGSETFSFDISGIPTSATVTNAAGDVFTGTEITVSAAQLEGLQITVPEGTASFDLGVTARSLDTDPDRQETDSAIANQTLAVSLPAVSSTYNDVIDGAAGDDEILGNQGDDIIEGGTGRDWIIGGTDSGSLTVTGSLDVTLTGSNAGYKNSFGYFIKGEDGSPETGEVVWANIKATAKGSVHSILLDENSVDDVGFFLIPNGSRANGDLEDGTFVTFAQDENGKWVAEADGEVLDGVRNAKAFFSGDETYNPDLLDHTQETNFTQDADGTDSYDLGFEDLYNGGDNDFNDAIFHIDHKITVGGFDEGDQLWGGVEGGTGDGEKDVFLFNRGDGVDTINDFEVGIDQLVISGYGRNEVSLLSDGDDTVLRLGESDAIKLVGVSVDELGGAGFGTEVDADDNNDGTLSVNELISLKDDLFDEEDGGSTPTAQEEAVVFVAPIEPGVIDGGNDQGNSGV